MKKMIFALAFVMIAVISAEGHKYYNKHFTISVRTFYDELLPYGEWLNTPVYGFVWRPYLDNAEDFRPYSTGGNWVYTDLGWTWVSDYHWGWAAFHYGRWYFDDYLGWMWIPGNEWAPAWVTWGSYNDNWAWAPMGPNIRVNAGFNFIAPAFWWTFVPFGHFCSDNWYAYRYNQPVQITNITYITNIYNDNNYRHNEGNWFYGPRVRDVERHLNSRVRKMEMVDTDRPDNLVARNNRVRVYRPGVANEREAVRPGKYRNAEAARTEGKNQRTTGFNTKRTTETGLETRTSNQTRGKTGTSAARNRPAKINRAEYTREAVSRSNPGSPQKPVFEHNARQSNNGIVLKENKPATRPATKSKPVRPSTSSRTKNN